MTNTGTTRSSIVCASGPLGLERVERRVVGAGGERQRQRDEERSAPAAVGAVDHQPSPSATVVVVLGVGAGRDVGLEAGALLLAVLLRVGLDRPLAAGRRHDAGGDDRRARRRSRTPATTLGDSFGLAARSDADQRG